MNILLVDDQEKILEATKKLVNWEKLSVNKVFTANSATAARRILSEKVIDIMLADIEMPGEDGIALQKWVSREYPEISSIFLTSHADFFYAQEAIRNGAFGYILQPASFTEIEEVVGNCISQLKKRKKIEQEINQYHENLPNILKKHVFAMFHQKAMFRQMAEWRKESHTEEENWWFLPCLIKIWEADGHTAESGMEKRLKDAGICGEAILCVTSLLDDNEIGIVFFLQGMVPDLLGMQEKIWFVCEDIRQEYNCELNLYMGRYAKDDLPVQIGQIMDFKAGRILKKNEVYLAEEVIPAEVRKPDGALWGRWMIRQDTALVKNQITNLLHWAEREQYLTISYMQKLIHAFLEACSIACYEQKQALEDLFTETFTYEQMLHSYSSVEELCEGVDICLRRYNQMLAEQGMDIAYSVQERIQEIIRYLEENMDRMISRREAAKYVFLNEDYFSRMFRKETGMGYKEYKIDECM